MNAINATILSSLFMPLFFGTTLAAAIAAILALFHLGQPGMTAMLATGLIYVIGMFACTAVFNVPLNNELTRAGADDAIWARYLNDWTFWNRPRDHRFDDRERPVYRCSSSESGLDRLRDGAGCDQLGRMAWPASSAIACVHRKE
jgi:hypothetical protein